jgi:lipid-binding SYLF domain-containing protein
MNTTRNAALLVAMIFATCLTGCASPKGDTAMDKRQSVQDMRAQALNIFYSKVPTIQRELAKAPGYGVFSGYSTQTIIVSTGNGFGVIRDNSTGQDTYMRAMKLGGGLGAGLQDVYAVVVFHDAKTMRDVLRDGWGVTGKVEAAAKIGDAGDSGAVVLTLPGMSIYRFAKNGVMVGGAIEGTKVWPDKELNTR